MTELDMLDLLPEQDRTAMTAFLAMMKGTNSLEDRMNAEHVTQKLEIDRQTEDHRFQKAKLEHNKNIIDRLFSFLAVLVVAGLIATILVLFRDNPEMVEKILVAVGGLIAGAIGGYGFGKSKRSE